jgi:hypothetical protein
MKKLKELNQSVFTDLIEKLEIPAEQTKKIIGTLEISIAKQISKDDDMHVVLDEKSVSELEESLRIGADISPEKAEEIVGDVVRWINRRRKKAVEFYERGILEVKKKS